MNIASFSFGVVLGITLLQSSQAASTYELDLNSVVDLGSSTAGGTFRFTYNLQSGPAVPGIGSSFTSDLTFGAFSGGNIFYDGNFGIQSFPTFGLTGFAASIDFLSMIANRPANNRQSEDAPLGDPTLALESMVNAGAIDGQGQLTLTMSSPPTVAGWPVISRSVTTAATAQIVGAEDSPRGLGVYAAPGSNIIGQPWERTFFYTSYATDTISDAVHASDLADPEANSPFLIRSTVVYVPEPSVFLSSVVGLLAIVSRRSRRAVA